MNCCVVGCDTKRSRNSKHKFYRVPRGFRPLNVKRRQLWLKAIQQANGSHKLQGNAVVCGAHFVLGEPCMDHDHPDFVPSVFPRRSPSPKKKQKWFFGCRKRRRKSKAIIKTPSKDDSPAEGQSSVVMDETQTSAPKEGETSTKVSETESENNPVDSQTSSSPDKSSSFKVPANILTNKKGIPTVLLKSIFAPESGYKCGQCDQVFTTASQLVRHIQLHEDENCDKEGPVVCEVCGQLFASHADFSLHQHVDEPLFPCNICDRSFTTRHNLKRHKLLHVKDGRKCNKCGVLFCRLHNHVLYQPQPATEQDSSMDEYLPESEPDHSTDLDDNAQSTVTTPLQTVTVQTAGPPPPTRRPLRWTCNPLPPPSYTRMISEVPLPVLIKSAPEPPPPPPPPVPRYFRNHYPEGIVKPGLPASLKMFSPLYLTSAFLEVKRDYEYILSKSGKAEMVIVKEEPCEHLLIPLSGKNIEHKVEEKDRIAYDLEIVI